MYSIFLNGYFYGHVVVCKDGTAQGVAKQRLMESLAKPNLRIVYDPYAEHFVLGSGLMKLMGHNVNLWLTQAFVPGFHEHLIARTRFIDELVEREALNVLNNMSFWVQDTIQELIDWFAFYINNF